MPEHKSGLTKVAYAVELIDRLMTMTRDELTALIRLQIGEDLSTFLAEHAEGTLLKALGADERGMQMDRLQAMSVHLLALGYLVRANEENQDSPEVLFDRSGRLLN